MSPLRRSVRRVPWVAGMLALLLANALAAWSATYAVTDLGTLGGNTSQARALTDTAPVQVVGAAATAGGDTHAFFWSSITGIVDLGTLLVDPQAGTFAGNSTAYGINGYGQIVGITSVPNDDHAFLWTPSTGMTDLGAQLIDNTSAAQAVNDSGQVTGYLYSTTGYPHAFLWSAGAGVQDLGTLGGILSNGFGINAAGQVAGDSTLVTGYTHAFLWSAGTGMRDLGTLPSFTHSRARAVNGLGQVAGYCTAIGGAARAFRWTASGGMRDLGVLPRDTKSFALGISAAGSVVGYSENSAGTRRAFLYTDAAGMKELNGMLSPALQSQWKLQTAYAINTFGQIVGVGLHNGVVRAFLLTPQ